MLFPIAAGESVKPGTLSGVGLRLPTTRNPVDVVLLE
jgi:hypothetical protein